MKILYQAEDGCLFETREEVLEYERGELPKLELDDPLTDTLIQCPHCRHLVSMGMLLITKNVVCPHCGGTVDLNLFTETFLLHNDEEILEWFKLYKVRAKNNGFSARR